MLIELLRFVCVTICDQRRGVKKRTTAMFLHAALCAAAVLACGAYAAAPDTGVTLRLWGIPPKSATYPIDVANRRVYEAFVARHPEIKVEPVAPLSIQGPAAEGSEFLAVAGGVAPDVFVLFGRKISDYEKQGFLAPLNGYLQQYRAQTGRAYDGINAPAAVWELCIAGTNVVCVPMGYYSMALMCRRDLFARAGLPLQAPADWNELYRVARTLTRLPEKEPGSMPGDARVYGMRLLGGGFAGWHMLQYIWSAGGEVVRSYYPCPQRGNVEVPPPPLDFDAYAIQISNPREYARQHAAARAALDTLGITSTYSYTELEWQLAVNEPGGAEALRFMRKLLHQPWLRMDGVEFDLSPEMLRAGRATIPGTPREVDLRDPAVRSRIYYGVARAMNEITPDMRVEFAMQIGTLTELSAYSASDVANVVPMPFPSISNGVPLRAFMAGHYCGINAAQPDPRVRAAAWTYIAFVTGPEAQRIRAETFAAYGLAEFVRPATLRALAMDYELQRIPPERRALWELLDATAKVEPYCRGFQHVMTRELGMAFDAMYGDRPARGSGYAYQRDPQAIMDAIATRVNARIMGRMSEAEVRRRARAGWLIAALIMAALALAAWHTVRAAARLYERASSLEGFGVGGTTIGRMLTSAAFLAPAVLTILIWSYYPLGRGLLMAFQNYRILGSSRFVGLRNFIETVCAPEFWRYVLQTFQYVALSLALGFFTPVALAIFLHEIPKGKLVLRTIYYLPAVTTGLVTMFLWKQLLYDPEPGGFLNQIMLACNAMPWWLAAGLRVCVAAGGALACAGLVRTALRRDISGLGRIAPLALAAGLMLIGGWLAAAIIRQAQGVRGLAHWLCAPFECAPQQFLNDPALAMFWLVMPGVWAGAGPGCLVYLAALKGVPEEHYEAADLDGAGLWSKLSNITFPYLSALLLINFAGAVVGAMQASQNIFVMTGGGPEDATMTVGLSIWYNAFMYLNFGMATSQAWILGALLIGFTLYQLRIMNRMQFRTAGGK